MMNLATFIEQLLQNQTAIAQASHLPICRIEVMSGLEDCTLTLAYAQRNALWNAQTRVAISLDGV